MKGSLTTTVFVASIALLGWSGPADANIDVELRPINPVVTLGDQAEIGLYLVSDDASFQYSSAADIILAWDNLFLSLAGNDDTGAYPLLSSGFPAAHPSLLNTTFADGDAMYTAFSNFGDPVEATPGGTLITTLIFDTLQATAGTTIDVPLTLNGGETQVFDSDIPNFNVLGGTSGATISIVIPSPAGALLVVGAMMGTRRRRR